MNAIYSTDKYGNKYQIVFWNEDFVVFSCEPELSFDVKAHELKFKKGIHRDYTVSFEVKDGILFMTKLEGDFTKPGEVMGAKPDHIMGSKLWGYLFEVPTDYTGLWQIGNDFDQRFWPKDDRTHRVPFSPEVYKQNGFIRFEKGKVVEMELKPREN